MNRSVVDHLSPHATLCLTLSLVARKNQSSPRNFEEALSELEKILSEIESGEIGLEDSIAKYERGQFLIQHCRSVLGKAEKQIESLNKEPSSEAAEATGGETASGDES